jgi:hypothetical protein
MIGGGAAIGHLIRPHEFRHWPATGVMSRDIVDRCAETSLAFRVCCRVSFRI